MKDFLNKIIIYFVIIMSFCAIMAGIQYINSAKKYLNRTNVYITNHKTFLLADSRGNKINTDSIGICNLSSPSENYIDIERKIEYLIDNKIEINHIILCPEIWSINGLILKEAIELTNIPCSIILNNDDDAGIFKSIINHDNIFVSDNYISGYIDCINSLKGKETC